MSSFIGPSKVTRHYCLRTRLTSARLTWTTTIAWSPSSMRPGALVPLITTSVLAWYIGPTSWLKRFTSKWFHVKNSWNWIDGKIVKMVSRKIVISELLLMKATKPRLLLIITLWRPTALPLIGYIRIYIGRTQVPTPYACQIWTAT